MSKQLEQKLVEDYFVEELQKKGWKFVKAENLDRASLKDPLLANNLRKTILKLNPDIGVTDDEIKVVMDQLILTPSGQEGSKKILHYLKYGIPVKFEKERVIKNVKLIDFENTKNNELVISRQFIFYGSEEIRLDTVLFVNGIPLVDLEYKNPASKEENWQKGYRQIKDYEQIAPELYKYIQIGVAVGAVAKYFPIVPWLEEVDVYEWKEDKSDVVDSTIALLEPSEFLDVVRNFLFYRERKNYVTKVIARYMQYRATNSIVRRVMDNLQGKDERNKGLIWHWQGSGKTLTMIFAAHKLYFDHLLEAPTIFFIVDRIELETQIFEELAQLKLNIAPEVISNIRELKNWVRADEFKGKRGLAVILIHKFQPEELKDINEELGKIQGETIASRKNIVVFLDEVHRSQYGLMAAQMKKMLKNAFFFGFTGTPISKADRDTYESFGYPLQKERYLDKYFMDDALRDKFTLRILYQPRLDKVHLQRELLQGFLDAEFEDIDEADKAYIEKKVSRRVTQVRVFLENPQRIDDIAKNIAEHFKENLDGKFKGMVVTGSRKACVLYKKALDKYLPPEYSELVITFTDQDEQIIKDYRVELQKKYPGKDDNEIRKEIKANFKEEDLPKIVIVTDMLLTGFDVPILQTMYLDKPLKEHRLLQAIARTNRPYKDVKPAGLVIDYVGILNDIEKAYKSYYEEPEIKDALFKYESLVQEFISILKELDQVFEGIPHTYERKGFFAAFDRLKSNEDLEKVFIERYWTLRKIFEMLGSNEIKVDHLDEFNWFSAIYNYYLRLKNQTEEKDELVNKFLSKSLKYIHRSTQIQKIKNDLPVLEFNNDYLDGIRKSKMAIGEKAANMVFTLERLVLVDQIKDPIYKSLQDRVEKLVDDWRHKAENYEAVYQESLDIFETISAEQKKREKLGLSILEYSIFTELAQWVNDQNQLVLLSKELVGNIKQYMLLEWQEQPALRKRVEEELRTFLRKKLKAGLGVSIEELDNAYSSVLEILLNHGKWN